MLRLLQFVARAANEHIPAVLDINLKRPLEAQQSRLPVHQGQQLRPEGGLERRILEEPIESLAWLCAAFQFNDDAQAGPIRLVAQIGDTRQSVGANQIGDALQKRGFVDLIRYLRDRDAVSAPLHLLDLCLGPHDDAPAPGGVSLYDPLPSDDDSTGGEIGAFHIPHQFIECHCVQIVPVIDHIIQRVADLHQVVGRDVGRHADGDAGRAVDQ